MVLLSICSDLYFLDDRHATPCSRGDEFEQVSRSEAQVCSLFLSACSSCLWKDSESPDHLDFSECSILCPSVSSCLTVPEHDVCLHLKPSKRLHIPTQVQPDMVVRISDSGVAYKEIVNWCARSTFYSEKAAWKEFDRRTTGSLHVTGEREHGQKKVDS